MTNYLHPLTHQLLVRFNFGDIGGYVLNPPSHQMGESIYVRPLLAQVYRGGRRTTRVKRGVLGNTNLSPYPLQIGIIVLIMMVNKIC